MAFSLETLNPAQREAVTYSGQRHCLILAGAGSGKTRVLTHRIAWLIAQGASPSSILAITFTNKAAREMRERALSLIDADDTSGLMLSTFHAFGARFLRHYATYAGLEPSFTIYAESEQKSLIKRVMKQLSLIGAAATEIELGDSKSNHAVNDYMCTLMGWKESGTSVEKARQLATSRAMQNIVDVYELYEKQLIQNNAVDFADLLLKPLGILTQFENVRSRVQARYRHILVDEFQDTNAVQLELLQKLCGEGTQLTVVGDDDQSIYTWRGSDPRAILEFSHQFGACDVFKLEQNYRSTRPILTCAGNLIACNEVRTEKRLWTEHEGGEKVHVISYASDWDEASDIISQLIARHRSMHLSWENFAILYRKNSQSVSFERECTHNAVPYQVVGGTGFYEREEIVDLMAYLRVLVNPSDRVSLRRIINKPVRGIGDKMCDKLLELVEKKSAFGLAPRECLRSLLEDVVAERVKIPRGGSKVIAGCRSLLSLFERVENWQNRAPRDTLLDILDETGFLNHLKKQSSKKGQDFSDVEDRIHSLIQELDAYQQKSPNDLPGFLEDMALIRPEADETQHKVNLMTIHSAKGLEFDVVFIVGAADGVLPLERGGSCDVEEERRLMYVAMTRARHVLTISWAEQSHEYGRTMCQSESRFIDEMQRADDEPVMDIVHIEKPTNPFCAAVPKLAWSVKSQTATKPKPAEHGFFEEVGEGIAYPLKSKNQSHDDWDSDPIFEEASVDVGVERRPKKPEREFVKDFEGVDDSIVATSKNGRLLKVGSVVRHSVHGQGVIARLERSGVEFKAWVVFKRAGVRTIIARFLEVP